MQHDPTIYIIAAALVSAAIGFMSCAVISSRRIRRAEFDGWIRGRNCQQRDKDFYLEHGSAQPRRNKATLESTHHVPARKL